MYQQTKCPLFLSAGILFDGAFSLWVSLTVDLGQIGLKSYSPSKKSCVFYVIENPLRMMKNAFYIILKALFALKIFKFFVQVGKTTWLGR